MRFLVLCFALLFSNLASGQTGEPGLLFPFKDDVEWHDDFAIDNIEGWIMADLDGLNPAGPFQSYPHQNQPQAFIVYTPSRTSPPNTFPEFQPRSGEKVFMSITSYDGPSNNWMITRELAPHQGGQFSFYAKGTFDFFGSEQFKVGYSSTGTEPGDFTFFNGGSPTTAAFVWTRYQYNIPAGVKHIAIVHVSYAYCFMVDDIEFKTNVASQSPGMITGFNAEVNLGESLAVLLDWTNPTVASNGNTLTELSGVKIFRGTHPMNFSEYAILENQDPGAMVAYVDDDIPDTGFYGYRLVPFNSQGDGVPFTSGFLFLDYETTPGAPHTILVTQNENLQSVISWNQVNYGPNGGPLQEPVTGYTLTRKRGNQTETLATMHPDTFFVETEIPGLNLYTYSVVAHLGAEVSGEPGLQNAYSGLDASQQPVTWGKYESQQVFELSRNSIISQSIYYADQIGSSGLITSLAYFSNLGSDGGSNTYKVYMSLTSRQVFGTSPSNVVWEYFGNQKLVYEGPVAFPSGPRAIEIDLDQPFFFDAASGKNLIITVVKPLTSNIPSVSSPVFYNTQVEGIRTYYAIGYGVDMSSVTTQPASWATEEVITIPSIVTTKVQDFATVTGVVTMADGTTVLEDVSVTVTPSAEDPEGYQHEVTSTGSDGGYQIPALLPGTYEVIFSKEGFNEQSVSVSVSPGEQLQLDVLLLIADPVIITGTVVNEAGLALPNAGVHLFGYSQYQTTTNASGEFSLQAYAEKDYQLEVSHPLYLPFNDTFVSAAEDYSLGTISLGISPHKPMNVVAALDEDGAQLNWEVPYGLDHESMLAWGTQTNVNDGWGMGGEEFIAGIRFSYLDLQEALPENAKLTHVKVHFHNYADFIIKVFQGSDANTILFEQEGSVDASGWYVFELNEAILIDQTQEFWIGIHFLPGYGAYPIGIDEGPNAPLRKGSMLYADGTWTGMSLTNKNWNIYGIAHTTVEANPMGYKVYRGLATTPQDDWTDLTPSLAETNSFADASILDEDPGVYRYGVVAHYGGELLSEMTPSNTVELDMLFDLAVQLQPNAPLPAGAFIRFWNNDYYFETRIQDVSNPAQFSDVWRGNYQMEIQADNFELVEMANLSIEESQTLEITLEERRVMPSALAAVMSEDGAAAELSWSLLDEVFDNFESYPDFEKTNIGDYILVDGDGLPTYTYTNFTWPGAGNPMSFMVFNPFATSPPVNLQAHSGRRYLVAMAGPDGVNNDWLIIPAGPGNFSFMARSLVSTDLETIQVLYSTSGSQPADFTAFQQGNNIMPPVQWTEYSFEAPEETKYLAIRYIGNDTYFLLLDDLSYQKPFDHVQSFNVYLDGALMAQDITGQTFELTGITAGTHLVEVEAVYHSGNSQKAQIEILGTVDVDDLLTESFLKVYPNPNSGNFSLSLAEPARVRILDMNGQVFYSRDLDEGITAISSGLKAGTYIIQAQTRDRIFTGKLVVK